MALTFLLVGILLIAILAWNALGQDRASERLPSSRAQEPRPATVLPTPAFPEAVEGAIRLPALPATFDSPQRVTSHSEPGRTYEVNLGRLTCSCPDFEGRRAAFSSDDIRRVCKHIGATLDETGALLSYDEIAQALIKNRTRERVHYGVLDERFFRFRDGPDEVLVGLRAGSEWITVVTRRGTRKRLQRYKRYGYSLAEDRWSYGSAPFKEGEMKAAIFAIYAAASLRSTSAAYPPS